MSMMFTTLSCKLSAAVRTGPSYSVIFVKPGADKGLAQMAELIREGKMKPIVDQVLRGSVV